MVLVILTSCKESSEKSLMFDFGKGVYKEPFRGILKDKPYPFVQSLKYPPYKWFLSDTLVFNKTFIIDFNEEALRSNSTAEIAFVDSLYNPVKELQFDVNGQPISNNFFTVKADSLSKTLNIQCKVHPGFGEQHIAGFLIIRGSQLDVVNNTPLQQELNVVADWKLEQKYKTPWLLWILWLLTIVLILAVIIILLCKIGQLLSNVFKAIAGAVKILPIIFTGKKHVAFSFVTEDGENGRRNRSERKTKKNDKESNNQDDEMGKRHAFCFKPWVGKSYTQGIDGKRVMALGESHYCDTPEEALPDITSNVVNYYLSQEREHEGWMNTYTRFASALTSGKPLSITERIEAWNKILFYNYVQVPIVGPRVAPTSEQFATGEKPFFELLEKYRPHRVLVWGKRLYNNLPQQGNEQPGIELPNGRSIEVWGYTLSDGSVVKLLPITHPSAPMFSPRKWYPVIQQFISS